MAILLLGAGLPAIAKDAVQWKTATVLYSHHQYSHDEDTAAQGGSSLGQSAREVFDLDAGPVTYTVEQWVVPSQMLRLQQGMQVEFAVSGKTLLLKVAGRKPRKLKLVRTYTKELNSR